MEQIMRVRYRTDMLV